MAFSFGNAAPAASGTNVQAGSDLEEIQTEALGFLAIAGESKIQLLSTPWPADNLPQPTASLLSIASHKGIVAAAGPDAVIIATTESVRKAFEGPNNGDGNFKPFQPQLSLPMPMRISQLAFSSDENYLILSAAEGGGLAVYEVQSLLQGSTESAFQVSTNGQALRALIPNPSTERSEFVAVVTNDGNLMMANLKDRNFLSGSNGQTLKDGVSCISWSTQGKQLVAGLGNGSAIQMTPDGVVKAEIPAPPNMENGNHVSSITWLENNVFLLIHTPTNFDNSSAPPSIYHIATRQPPSSFLFQKVADPAPPFGLNRSPPHHFLLRLRNFPPNIQDLIVVASTASTDIGLFSRSKVPLSGDKPSDKITGVFTMTEMADDSRRAQLPMTGDLGDTSPIGTALDLSSREKVVRPIPRDEMDESPTPLPAVMVLNNEGVLATWWVVYTESIRQNTAYPGLVSAEGAPQPMQSAQASSQPAQTSAFGGPVTKPAFGQSTFGTPSTAAPAFGSTTTPGTFGAPSGLGQSKSPWGAPSTTTSSTGSTFGNSTFGSAPASNNNANTTSAFGTSSFGTPTAKPASSGGISFGTPAFGSTSTPAFGSSGLPGGRPSPWASAGSGAAFGQPSGLGKTTPVFGSAAAAGSTPATVAPAAGSGFASFANQGGFAAAAAPSSSGSIFGGQKPDALSNSSGGIFGTKQETPVTKSGSIFGANPSSPAPSNGSIFGGAKPTTSIFGAPSNTQNSLPFGTSTQDSSKSTSAFGSSSNFVLGSTFKPDGSTKEDALKPSGNTENSLFGGNFGSALGDVANSPLAKAAVSQETDMDDDSSSKPEPPKEQTTTPASTPAPPKFTSTPASSSIFGSSSPVPPNPFAKQTPVQSGLKFGQPSGGSNSALDQDAKSVSTEQSPRKQELAPFSSLIKPEPNPESNSNALKNIPEAPFPPDPSSKTSYAPGDTSESSISTDAPLPPDFMPKPLPMVEKSTIPEVKKSIEGPTSANILPPSHVPLGSEDGDEESDFLTEGDEDKSSTHRSVEEDEDDDGESEEHESEAGDDEGSGEDVAKDLSPPQSTAKQTQSPTPQSSFGGSFDQSPSNGLFGSLQRPKQPAPANARSLFGEIDRSAPVLPPPKSMASPRSPSPMRSAIGRLQRPDTSRSVSAPGVASQLLGNAKPPLRTVAPAQTLSFAIEQQKAEEARRAAKRAQKEVEERQALVDDEDEMTQKFLSSDITATRHLDEFVAHSDYVNKVPSDSIPAQIETVYRDINSMIDTLGLNARALKSFMKGHSEHYKVEGRTSVDLEDEQDWVLVEIEDLGRIVEKDLVRELESGKLDDVASKLEACNELQKELTRLWTRHEDVKKIMALHSDPDQLAIARAQPLSAEQLAQQHDLRKQFRDFQGLLAKAEEELTILKVALASHSGSGTGKAVPTVEAVMRTITKMMSMAEKRSGDVDVLENQMRKLRFSSAASSREGSPFATPQKRISMRNPGNSSTYGLFFTPDNIKDHSRNLQTSLMSSTSSHARASPSRKKMSLFSPEEKTQLRSKMARRNEVAERLRAALQKSGTSVRTMDDNDD